VTVFTATFLADPIFEPFILAQKLPLSNLIGLDDVKDCLV